MPAYERDPFTPSALRCTSCGRFVTSLADVAQVGDELPVMTCRQVLACWPGAARDVAAHDLACAWQQAEAAAPA